MRGWFLKYHRLNDTIELTVLFLQFIFKIVIANKRFRVERMTIFFNVNVWGFHWRLLSLLTLYNDLNQLSFDQRILLNDFSHLDHLVPDKDQEVCLVLVSLQEKLIDDTIALLRSIIFKRDCSLLLLVCG